MNGGPGDAGAPSTAQGECVGKVETMKVSEVEVEFIEIGETPDGCDGWVTGTRVFDAYVSFTVGGKTWGEEFKYHQGPGITTEPDPVELLGCLASDAFIGSGTFADFCDEIDYDEDSRKAFATWEACRESYRKLEAVFGTRLDEFMTTEWSD